MIGGKMKAGGLIQHDHLAMVGIMDMPSRPGVSGKLFSELNEQGINVEIIVHLIGLEEKDHIVLCVDRDDVERTKEVAERIRQETGGRAITCDPEVASISLFGSDFRESRGVARQMFKALGDSNINIRAISTSLSTISCVIEAICLDEAVEALREAFIIP